MDHLLDNITSSGITGVGSSKFECISTPWVRLFSRYMVLILIYVKFPISILLLMFPHLIGFSLSANDGDLLFGDHHEFPLLEGPLRLEILDKHLRGNLLRVERLGEPI